MSARFSLACRVTCCAAVASCNLYGQAPATIASRATLDQYCVTCHNERAKTAGLMLDTLDLARVGE